MRAFLSNAYLTMVMVASHGLEADRCETVSRRILGWYVSPGQAIMNPDDMSFSRPVSRGMNGDLLFEILQKWLAGGFSEKSLWDDPKTRNLLETKLPFQVLPFGIAPFPSPPYHSPSARLAFDRRSRTNVLWASLLCFTRTYSTVDTVGLLSS